MFVNAVKSRPLVYHATETVYEFSIALVQIGTKVSQENKEGRAWKQKYPFIYYKSAVSERYIYIANITHLNNLICMLFDREKKKKDSLVGGPWSLRGNSQIT